VKLKLPPQLPMLFLHFLLLLRISMIRPSKMRWYGTAQSCRYRELLLGVCCHCINQYSAASPAAETASSSGHVHVEANTISIRLRFSVTPRQFVLYSLGVSWSRHPRLWWRTFCGHGTSPRLYIRISFVNVVGRMTHGRQDWNGYKTRDSVNLHNRPIAFTALY